MWSRLPESDRWTSVFRLDWRLRSCKALELCGSHRETPVLWLVDGVFFSAADRLVVPLTQSCSALVWAERHGNRWKWRLSGSKLTSSGNIGAAEDVVQTFPTVGC